MSKPFQIAPFKQPDRIHGLIFDGAFFLGNVVWLGSYGNNVDNLPDKTIGLILGIAIITQFLGAWLKQGSLGQRLQQTPKGQGVLDGWMNLLIFLHFILFTVIALMCFMLLRQEDNSTQEDYWVLVAALIAGITSYMVWRAGKGNDTKGHKERGLGLTEYVADGLLWVSISIITRFFWDTWYVELTPSRGIGLSGNGIILILGLSILFVVFFLPGRYLYLIEDYRFPGTWLRMWLVGMAPLIWFIIVG
jgi:hypothetical protein